MRKIINSLIYFFDYIIPKNDKQFTFTSFPDMSDNSYAMFKYILNYFKDEKIKIIWLLSNIENKYKYKEMILDDMDLSPFDIEHVVFVQKNSFIGLLYYFQSKYIFFTHGLYPRVKFPKDHILINLWHGMPLKTIGFLDNPNNKDVPESTFTIATSSYFQTYMASAFGMEKSKVLLSGQPRNEFLFIKNSCLEKFGVNKSNYKKIFLWTPTYRQATIGYENTDGELFDGLPIIGENYQVLNDYLKSIKSYMIVKLHPMDVLNKKKFEKFTNLLFMNNNDLEKHTCQLNQILNNIDILITDFSSVYIDFLLLDKPIGFAMDDFNSFSKSRGFVMEDPKIYMPGDFISSKKQFFDFLKESVQSIDQYKIQRREVNEIFNEIKSNFSEKLWIQILKYEK